MKFPHAGSGWALLVALAILTLLPVGLAASDEPPAEPIRPDYTTIARALDGDPAAIESLMACAGGDADCRMITAAALHRQGRTEEAIDLLRPALARGSEQAARVVSELAFEREDYRLAWAAGRIWMDANDLEPPTCEVDDRGMRIPWLMGQAAQALSGADLDQARELAENIRLSRDDKAPGREINSRSVQRASIPDIANRTAPEYPREMARTGSGGWAILVISVAADGKVEDVRELFSSRRALADNSIEAIRTWRFKPAENGGWWGQQVMEFELSERRSTLPEADSGVPDKQGWIRFDDARGWIEFTVRVNGVPVRAMLDSGAEGNAVSRRLVERAGIDLNLVDEVRVQGIYGREVVPTTSEFELRFGGATVPVRGALVLPISSPDLILGVGLFQASVVQIDYPNKRIRFLNRDVVDFEGNVRVRTERGRAPQVAGELNGKRVWMLLDTGNAGATLFKSRLLRRLDLERHVVNGSEISGSGAVSSGRSRLLQLPGFKLGPFPFETLLARHIEEGGQRGFEGRRTGYGSRILHDNVPYDGILGSEVLKNFIITADLQKRKVHFAVP